MSAVNSAASIMSSAAASYVAKVAGSVSSSQCTPSYNPVQEATETPAQTMKEAASGDRVAIAKLAKEEKAAEAQVTVSEPGKGEQIDKTA